VPRANLIMFTPGPVRIPALVAEYLADPPCNYHRQDGFKRMFETTETLLKELIGIKDGSAYFATILTTTGTGANEACLLALEGLGKGVILENGFFGQRLASQCKQGGIDHVVLSMPENEPMDPMTIDTFLTKHPEIKWAYFVTHETRMGLRNPTELIGQICKKHGLIVGADMVSSAWSYKVDIEAAQLDLATTTSAKAIMAVPGLGIVFVKNATVPALKAARRPGASNYYLDLMADYDKWRSDKAPRFGQPVVLHSALHGACLHMKNIGVDNHMRRIRRQMDELTAHCESIGVMAQLEPAYRSNIAVNFKLPGGMLYTDFTKLMAAEGYYILYGIAEDPTLFQLSTIGDLTDEHVQGLKKAMTKVIAAWQLPAAASSATKLPKIAPSA
jgi:2-aminoethylphosphonate-pyruvate transaminase